MKAIATLLSGVRVERRSMRKRILSVLSFSRECGVRTSRRRSVFCDSDCLEIGRAKSHVSSLISEVCQWMEMNPREANG